MLQQTRRGCRRVIGVRAQGTRTGIESARHRLSEGSGVGRR